MTRGMYNEKLPAWIQEFAGMNGVTIDPNPEEYGTGSVYSVSYRSEKILLEERRGPIEEVATLLSGEAQLLEELVEETDFYLDTDRRSREVILR